MAPLKVAPDPLALRTDDVVALLRMPGKDGREGEQEAGGARSG
jgi:hypothetical protein